MRFREPAPDAARGARVVYLGDDQHGVALEVMAVELSPNELLVIHSMPLWAKYLAQYKEATAWRV